jgi:hypothetical protein
MAVHPITYSIYQLSSGTWYSNMFFIKVYNFTWNFLYGEYETKLIFYFSQYHSLVQYSLKQQTF